MIIGRRKWNYFGVKKFFFENLDLKNEWKNEFKDKNEKSCSWSINSVSHKIDFKDIETNKNIRSVKKPSGRTAAMPTARELSCTNFLTKLKYELMQN